MRKLFNNNYIVIIFNFIYQCRPILKCCRAFCKVMPMWTQVSVLMTADGDRTVTRGNPFKLSVNYCRTNTRKNFLANVSQKVWNGLSSSIVTISSQTTVRNSLNKISFRIYTKHWCFYRWLRVLIRAICNFTFSLYNCYSISLSACKWLAPFAADVQVKKVELNPSRFEDRIECRGRAFVRAIAYLCDASTAWFPASPASQRPH